MPSSDSFLAVYGSLRRRSLAKQRFFVLRDLQFYGYGILRGLFLIQNGYPAVLEQPGQVRVEIFRVEREGILEELDRYEGYLPALGSRSLFYRKEVDLIRPEIRALVYFLGREVPRGRRPVYATLQAGGACDRLNQKISIFRRSADPVSHPYSLHGAKVNLAQNRTNEDTADSAASITAS
jgi:gamma-glutamylcyclotransferase (GGCT)/AIG2-like uncharacterized protein YtfP